MKPANRDRFDCAMCLNNVCNYIAGTTRRTAKWVPQTNTGLPGYTNPTKALFYVTVPSSLVADASVSEPSGVYVFDRESVHGPVFRHGQDRRWKLAKGALNADRLFNNNTDFGAGDAWFLYNITTWAPVVQSPHMSTGFETDPRPERLKWCALAC